MKLLLVVALAALCQAQVDWSKVKPRHVDPLRPVRPRPILYNDYLRITGGEEVVPHSRPFQVGLMIYADDGTYFCGGSLISPGTVLTAAHCGELTNNIEVVLGAHRIREVEPTQVRINGSTVLVHPDWDSLLLENDLALINLPAPVELNENIGTVNLPANDDNDYTGTLATASGWGKDSDAAAGISEVLRQVTTPVITNEQCNEDYFGIIIDTHICTDGADGKSTCSGDSGGPLVDDATNTQIGIVSFGISFGCEIGWPPAFTRVSKYLDWIAANAQ